MDARPTRGSGPRGIARVAWIVAALTVVAGVVAVGWLALWFAEGREVFVRTAARPEPEKAERELLPAPLAAPEIVAPRREVEGMRIAVLDADGRPAAERAVVVLRAGFPPQRLFTARTGADGSCTIAGFERRLLAWLGSESIPPLLVVAVDQPLLPAASRRFPTMSLRAGAPTHVLPDDVALTLPRTTSLTIELVGEDGRRVRERAVAFLLGHASRVNGIDAAIGPAVLELVDGRGTLAEVEPELDVEIEVSGARDGGGALPWRIPPTDATVQVPIALRSALVAARAVDGDHRPLAERELRDAGGATIRTDARGRFFTIVRPMEAKSVGEGERDEHWPESIGFELIASEAALQATGWAGAPLPAPFGPGWHDLGDLRFDAGELAVAGRVTDAAGTALPDVHVSVAFDRPQPGHWSERNAPTDHTGRFELRVPERRASVRVRARKAGWASSGRDAPAELLPFGTTDLELVLVRPPTLTGSFRLPSGVAARNVRVVATQDPGDDGSARTASAPRTLSTQRCTVAEDGTFRIELSSGGAVEVAILTSADREPLRTIELRDFGPEPEQAPPELQEIELPASLRTIALDVRDREGQGVAGADLFRREPRADSDRSSVERIATTDGTGCVELCTNADSLDLLIVARGRRAAWLDRVRSDTRVTLDPPLEVRVVLDDAESHGLEPACIHGFFEPIDTLLPYLQGPGATTRNYAEPDGAGRLRGSVPVRGTWRLRLFYRPPTGGSRDLGAVAFDVEEVDRLQSFRRSIDAKLASDALTSRR